MPDLDFYTGAYTGAQIDQRLGNMVVVVRGTITDQQRRITNSKILENHVVIDAYLSNWGAQVGNWTITTAVGYLDVAGTISGSTTLTLILGLT